ncbi:hypothetical protein SGPA1_10819 [Streptomyces misionensis JCM 4497]
MDSTRTLPWTHGKARPQGGDHEHGHSGCDRHRRWHGRLRHRPARRRPRPGRRPRGTRQAGRHLSAPRLHPEQGDAARRRTGRRHRRGPGAVGGEGHAGRRGLDGAGGHP